MISPASDMMSARQVISLPDQSREMCDRWPNSQVSVGLDDALPSVIPSPEPDPALQMHPTEPPVDAAGCDPIEFAGQHRPAGVGERHAALQHATFFNGR